jgi:hypothetical protein
VIEFKPESSHAVSAGAATRRAEEQRFERDQEAHQHQERLREVQAVHLSRRLLPGRASRLDLMSSHLAIRLDHGTTISREPDVARRVAQILTRPALAMLARVSAREKDRWSKNAPATAETVELYLTNETNALHSPGQRSLRGADRERGDRERSSAQCESAARGPLHRIPRAAV